MIELNSDSETEEDEEELGEDKETEDNKEEEIDVDSYFEAKSRKGKNKVSFVFIHII